ncbi:uncharacterized protein LOC103999051 [Musa acuminata AAA Group]|uniref:uncharacterized protein LOC103999051 n=1 Tax=Musa acuminata AAA Group TaxID=214697 RepID=UPI0031D3B6FF
MARVNAHRRLLPSSPPVTPRAGVAPSAAGIPVAPNRKHPVILKQPTRPGARCAEVAGGTAADCVAVCCLGPCLVVNLLVLTAVRLPAVACRRALRAREKRRQRARKRKEKALLGPKAGFGGDGSSSDAQEDSNGDVDGLRREAGPSPVELEREMLAQFHGMGFWRSPSNGDRAPTYDDGACNVSQR